MEKTNGFTASAEQLHMGRVNYDPEKGSDLRLFIDLDVCTSGECERCEVECDYFYHPANVGIVSAVELATYYLVCRRCEDPHCVKACPKEALEQQEDKEKMLVRYPMRCISCRSCSHACPYGTIYPELVPQLVHICDFCCDRRDQGEPACIASCPYGALRLERGDIDLDENTFLVGDNLIIHSTHWEREKA